MSSRDPDRIRVLAIAGSLRKDSFNRRLLQFAPAAARATMTLRLYDDLSAVPLFNEDLEVPVPPPGVAHLRSAVADADGVLLATPEYNQSLPAVTKNLVDWLSRDAPLVLEGKPIGILGVTAGSWGTRIAQGLLRHTLTACGALIMPVPQLYLRNAAELFDAEGRLIDARAQESLAGFLASFEEWVRRMR